MRARLALATLLLLVTGCGPRSPLSVGIKELPSSLTVGKPSPARTAAPVSAPVPPFSIPLNQPALRAAQQPAGTTGGPSSTPPPPSPPPACPDPARGAVIRDVAVNTFANAPEAGSYPFRGGGGYSASGANASGGTFPAQSARTVANPRSVSRPGLTGPLYRFDVSASLGALVTTTTYTVFPEASAPQASVPADTSGTGQGPGLYITAVHRTYPDGTTEDFTPSNDPGLLLLPFPAAAGKTWTASGADPSSAQFMSFNATEGSKTVINACGTPLEALTVHLDGTFGPNQSPGFVGPSYNVTFSADYSIGTQYGGLSLGDSESLTKAASGASLRVDTHATIDVVPAPAASPS